MMANKEQPYVFMVNIGRPFRQHEVYAGGIDWGHKGENVLAIDRVMAGKLVHAHPKQYRIVKLPSDVHGVDIPKDPKEFKTKDLVAELVSRAAEPGQFIHELRDVLLKVRGDVFPISCNLTDEDVAKEMDTRGFHVVKKDLFESLLDHADRNMTKVKSIDLEDRLNLLEQNMIVKPEYAVAPVVEEPDPVPVAPVEEPVEEAKPKAKARKRLGRKKK
jgi:hypothetical protein